MSARAARQENSDSSSSAEGRTWVLPALFGLIALSIGAAFWMRGGSTTPEEDNAPTRPNLLLITMDTTRADHLGCYGHPTSVTPNINQIAQEGVLFEQCVSSAPGTLSSHASILTSLYPFVHGARDNVGYRLSEANTTLPEILHKNGFVTGAFVSATPLHRRSGIDQGFETFRDAETEPMLVGGETCDRAIHWLRKHADKRLFAWVHFYDSHFPYEAPGDFVSSAPNPYLREIAYMDTQIGRLISELKRLNLYENTIIALVADHGESLGQHAEMTHLYFLYDTTIHVPLILRAGGMIPENLRIDAPVRTVDIAPTLLAMLDLQPLAVSQGTNLQPLIADAMDAFEVPAYAETIAGKLTLGTSILRSLRLGQWKYIHAPRAELYDLSQDPGELQNVATDFPQQTQTMQNALRGLIAESPQIDDGADHATRLGANELARLESLGYVGGDQSNRITAVNELDIFEPNGGDPKDFAAEISTLSEAQHRLSHGEFSDAEAMFRTLVERFPDVVGLRERYARTIFSQNRFDEAIKIYEALCAEHPNNVSVRYGYGKLLDKVGRRVEAIEQLAATVRLDPEHAEACHDLAVVWREEGRIDEAIRHFRRAIRARPSYVQAHVDLAMLYLDQKQFDKAIVSFRNAAELSPDNPRLQAYVAFAMLKAGQYDSAQAAARSALDLDANYKPALRILADIKRIRAVQSEAKQNDSGRLHGT
jgi:arylsulfatase A-like enzyme/Flp pilus assembly protein TadD